MSCPHPSDDRSAVAYGHAWSSDPRGLLEFFASAGSYTDVAMGTTHWGHDGIARFHRWTLNFAPDSVIDFAEPCVIDGRLCLEWVWTGTFDGSLRLPDGTTLDATGKMLSAAGVASCRYGGNGKLISHRDYWDLATVVHQVDGPPLS